MKVLAGLYSLLEALGENLYPCLLQLLGVACPPWLMAPLPFQKLTALIMRSSYISLILTQLAPTPLLGIFVITL